MIVFALCHDHIDGATIYRDRTEADPKGQDSSVSVREWDAVSSITPKSAMQAALDMASPSQAWRAVGAAEPLRPGVRYTAYGWTHDNSWYTAHVEFTLDRLSALKPGQVLSQAYVQAKNKDVDVVQPYAEFAADACSNGPKPLLPQQHPAADSATAASSGSAG